MKHTILTSLKVLQNLEAYNLRVRGSEVYHKGNLGPVTETKDGMMTVTMYNKLKTVQIDADVNRPITDSVSTTSSTTTASATAVKTAYDRAVSGEASAKAYAETYADGVKSDILGGASAAYDTLLELQNVLEGNDDAITTINNTLTTKVDKSGDIMTGNLSIHSGTDYRYLQVARDLGVDTWKTRLNISNDSSVLSLLDNSDIVRNNMTMTPNKLFVNSKIEIANNSGTTTNKYQFKVEDDGGFAIVEA